MNISERLDNALFWTCSLTGGIAGVVISNAALRVINSSFLNWYSGPIDAGLILVGIAGYHCLVRMGSSHILKDTPPQRVSTVRWIFGAFGTASTAIITIVALRVLFCLILNWYGLALLTGISIASGILHSQLTNNWLSSSIPGGDDQKIRDIVKGADKLQLFEFYPQVFSRKLLDEKQALIFADAYGQREDVSTEEAAKIFNSFKHSYCKPKIHLEPDLGLSKITLLKLREADSISWTPYALCQRQGESICEIVKETEKSKLKEIFATHSQFLNLNDVLLVFVDHFGQRNDVSPDEVAEVFKVAANMGSVWVGPQGTFSEVTLGKLLVHFSGNGDFSKFKLPLFDYTKKDPERQIQILREFPLGSDSIFLDTSSKNAAKFSYPCLAKETVQYLLDNDPTVWDLAICQQQCEDRFEQWDTVQLEDLQPLIDSCNKYKYLKKIQTTYWDSSLLRVVVKSLSDKQVTTFLKLLLEKKANAFLSAFSDTLKKRDETAIEGLHALTPQIIALDREHMYKDDTILSYMLMQREFLDICHRQGLCSFLHREISDRATHHLIEEIQKQNPSPFTIDELTIVSYALFSDSSGPHEPASISVDAIRWMANGNRGRFLWLLKKLLKRNPLLYITGTIPTLPPGISAKEKELLLEERALFWLAQTVTAPEFTIAPDWVTKAVTRCPETFGFALGHWHLFERKDQKHLLRLLIQSLQLEEEAINKLGSSYAMKIDNRYSHITTWEVPGRAVLNWIVHHAEWQALTGNPIIETLASALVFEESCYTVMQSRIENNGPFAQLPKDMFEYLCRLLGPRDLANLASACRELFHRVGGPGSLRWKDRKIGSIRVVKMPEIKSKSPLIELPQEAFERICLFLEPEDLARIAQTCRHLFFQICGPKSRVWKQKKLGSTRAIRLMNHLSRPLEETIQREIHGPGIDLLQQFRGLFRQIEPNDSLPNALFLAWPANLLSWLHQVESQDQDSVSSKIPLLFGQDTEGKSFIIPGQEPLEQIFDRLVAIPCAHPKVIARFLRDNPEYFTYPKWATDINKVTLETWQLLEQFGLPWNGVKPFCKGIINCYNEAGGWDKLPRQLRNHIHLVLIRLQEDHAHFIFKKNLPDVLYSLLN